MSYDYDERPSYNTPISPRAPMWLTPEERAAGIHKDLKIAARRFLCPNCGHEFSLFQSRAVACKGVQPLPVEGRRMQGMPPGEPELPLCEMSLLRLRVSHQGIHRPRQQGGPGSVPDSKEDQVHMSAYADKVFNKWQDSYGNNRR